jgi:hypothetical protein
MVQADRQRREPVGRREGHRNDAAESAGRHAVNRAPGGRERQVEDRCLRRGDAAARETGGFDKRLRFGRTDKFSAYREIVCDRGRYASAYGFY